jgi:hypothetical protein
MLNYLLVTNILLLFVVIVLVYKWNTQRTYNRKLFNRSWALERTLMEVYDECTEAGRETIQTTLNGIIPL